MDVKATGVKASPTVWTYLRRWGVNSIFPVHLDLGPSGRTSRRPRRAHRHLPGHEWSPVGGPYDVVAGALAQDISQGAALWTLRGCCATTATGRSAGRPHSTTVNAPIPPAEVTSAITSTFVSLSAPAINGSSATIEWKTVSAHRQMRTSGRLWARAEVERVPVSGILL